MIFIIHPGKCKRFDKLNHPCKRYDNNNNDDNDDDDDDDDDTNNNDSFLIESNSSMKWLKDVLR